MSMPTNATGFAAVEYACHTCCRCGVSSTHGAHHEPQTLTTTTLPAASAAVDHALPSTVVPASVTAAPRSATASCSTVPSPAT